MRIAVSADDRVGVADQLVPALEARGHVVVSVHGALAEGDDPGWTHPSADAARLATDGTADQAVVCCWTGTGASIAANKVQGVRAALCTDAETAAGARRWNDANVLALSLRSCSEAVLDEILDAWFEAEPSPQAEDVRQVLDLTDLEEHS
jgi:ribose 5-phosphate isomerase B